MTDFDRTVRKALSDVAGATHEAPDLADRLVANVQEGRIVVTPLRRARRGGPWVLPLLAAAAVVVVAGGVVATSAVLSDRDHRAGTQRPTPSVPVSSLPSVPKPTRPVPAGFSSTGAYFADQATGWAVGDGACATSGKSDCPSLIHTTDGGRSWHALGVPAGMVSTHDYGSCGSNGDILGPCVDNVFFADEADGYLWSLHEFYWTTDGGKTWQREPHATDGGAPHSGAAEMVLVDGRILRMRPIHDCSSGCRGVLQSAAIGSDSWTDVTPAEAGLYTSHLQVSNGTVYFDAGDTADGAGTGLYRSTDAGQHWQHLAARPCGPNDANGSGPGSSRLSLFAVGFDGATVVQCHEAQDTVRVAAGGSTTFSSDRDFPTGTDANYELWGAISARRILLWRSLDGRNLQLVSSDDGGRSWQNGPRFAATTYPQMVTVQFGYVVNAAGTGLFVTDDGGRTWGQQDF